MDGGEHHQLTASMSSVKKPNDSNVEKQTLIRMTIKRRLFLRPCSPNQHDRPALLCSITGSLISALLWPSHELQLVLALLALTKTVMKRASACPHILINSEIMPWTADCSFGLQMVSANCRRHLQTPHPHESAAALKSSSLICIWLIWQMFPGSALIWSQFQSQCRSQTGSQREVAAHLQIIPDPIIKGTIRPKQQQQQIRAAGSTRSARTPTANSTAHL